MAKSTGGYIGNTPSFDAPNGFLPGAWTLQAAYDRIRIGEWPVISPFPPAYRTLISSFATQRFVSPTGSDSNNGTTEDTAWATINYAVNTSVSGTAIILLPGTHTAASWGSVDYVLYAPPGKNLVFIGSPGQTIVVGTNTSNRDSHFAGLWSGSAAYGLTLRRNNNNRIDNYMVAIWGNNSNYDGTFWNCVLEETHSSGRISHNYDNGGSGIGRTRNSLVIASNWLSSYSGGASNQTTDCAFTATASLTGTFSNNANNVSYNATTYALSSENTVRGVYSGTYAWPLP